MRLLVRADLRRWIVPLLQAAPEGWRGYTTEQPFGGRGGARIVPQYGVVVRPYRRGGLPAWLLHDTYFGWRPRPFRELCVTATLHERGAPVIEVYGAAVEWLVPGSYRGWLATRYSEAAHTLWEWAATPTPTKERVAVFANIGKAIRRLHACGARHPDLNANNILLGPSSEVVFIDFDRARIGHIRDREGAADLDRLWRSLRKLDPDSRLVTAADFEVLRAGYREGPSCT